MNDLAPATLLFVCTGNICRSPTAEAIASALIARRGLQHRYRAASAGTHGYHIGEAPDPRARKAAHERGYNLDALCASKCELHDIQHAHTILALDHTHLQHLLRLAPPVYHPRITLLMDHARHHPGITEVPDPYYARNPTAFHHVIDLCEDAIAGLLDHLTHND